ncbi:GYD domain-containing protein [Haloplanus sp. GCM10025708]|uniref:GYD domain-containing protein n=1 Tax=Haloferacaceae TaxID=1644056 RepID=UPI003610BFFA
MPTFISLVEYTAAGIANMKESPERLERAEDVVESMGGELKEFYLTMGQYDAVVVMEFPDAESAAQAAITIGEAGAIETETLTAFPEDEYRDLIAELP